jgi:hypothetical protein
MRPLLILSLAGVLFLAVLGASRPASGVMASRINAGCYIVAPGRCNIHVDPFTVKVTAGKSLLGFKLRENNKSVYEFATDASNPPGADYSTASPRLDLDATCGESYSLILSAKDSGDAGFQDVGATSSFVCPDGTGWLVWIPSAVTGRATVDFVESAMLHGIVNAQGGSTLVKFQYGKTDAYGEEIVATPSGFSDASDRAVSVLLTGLDPTSTYHYRVVAQNSAGTVFGKDRQFKTLIPNLAPIYLLLLN